MLPWEKQPMHASLFCSVPEGTGQLSCTCKQLLDFRREMRISDFQLGWLLKGIMKFLGPVADFYPDLRKS